MRKKRSIKLAVPAGLASLLVLAAVFADKICPYDPYAQNLSASLLAPSPAHLMGTDLYGRDMLSRVIIGGRISILSALLLVCIITVAGTAIGVIGGWAGGWIDALLMRISDFFLAFPGLIFAMAIAALLQNGMPGAVISLALTSWPKYARLVRSETLSAKENAYVDAAIVSGSDPAQIIFRHILPNIADPIIVTAASDIGTMMMELAGFSFLGLGAKPPAAEWGSMMSAGRSMLMTCPWIVLAPGIAIFISVAVFHLLGDALRDHLDPHHAVRLQRRPSLRKKSRRPHMD